MNPNEPLTLGTLKAHLASLDLPDDTIVIVDGYEGGFHSLTADRVRYCVVQRNPHVPLDSDAGMFGPYDEIEVYAESLTEWERLAGEETRALALSISAEGFVKP